MFSGRLDSQKRIDVLLDSFAAVRQAHPDALLRLLGSGSLHDELVAQASSLGLNQSVEFMGQLAPHEVAAQIEASTMLVMSSDYEGMPMAALEAAQRGRPIISTDVGGMREIVVHGTTGTLVPPRDVPALAAAITCALSNRDATDAMGAAAAARATTTFGLSACADAYEVLYREAVDAHQVTELAESTAPQ